MTFLEMCSLVDKKLGTQGTFSTVATTNGFQLLIVDAVATAWSNIQSSRKDWAFFESQVAFSTVAGQQDYSLAEVFGVGVADPVDNWVVDRFIKADYSTLNYVAYGSWIIQDHTASVDPTYFTVHPNLETAGYLSFDNPNAIYNYTLHYNRIPQVLALDADIPLCPATHHLAIVYQAVADLAYHLGNADIHASAGVQANQLYGNLLRSQLPAKVMNNTRTFA